MESLVADKKFWEGKRVFLTGHTGFKGSWLALWLNHMGAKVHGYAIGIPTAPSLYKILGLEKLIPGTTGDINDPAKLGRSISDFKPEIVIHMAAQSLVRESYKNPMETYQTNVMGTATLLNICREINSIRVILNVTTDKCYENTGWVWPFRENDRLGGHDPYSCSKACSELLTHSFSSSFFANAGESSRRVGISTARAGNVIGGGDWARDRLIPDCIRAFISGRSFTIRYPGAIRPWQYVLDPLNGYLLLIENMVQGGKSFSGPWNFGPADQNTRCVREVANALAERIGAGDNFIEFKTDHRTAPDEAQVLKLDSSKAAVKLGWQTRIPFEKAIDEIAQWTLAYLAKEDMLTFSIKQIDTFCKDSGVQQ